MNTGKIYQNSAVEYWVVSTDRGTVLLVLCFAVTDVWELVVRAKHTTSEPYCITLYHVLIDTYLDGCCLGTNKFLVSV